MASTQPDPTRKRKFALVKCERCRLDKQKCLPIQRDWPIECNRCLEKGFPCSPGRRIQRRSKHEDTLPHPPSPSDLQRSSTSDDSILAAACEKKVRDFGTLLSCHGIMNLALKRLHDLKKTTLAPFLDKWHTETEFNRVLKFGTYKQLMSRFAGLELKLAQLRQEIDIDVRRYPLHPGSVSILLNQALPLFAWQTSCPVCNRLSGDDDILHNLERKGDFARAYLTRLSRLSRHFVVQYHWSQDSPALLEAEICGLYSLAIGANESIQDALTRHNLFETLPDESQYNSLYRPDEINFGMALDEQADIDCLGRTGLHQALDAVPILEKEYVQPRAILLAQLLTFLADRPLEYINQQDILGRTLLHIATQKGWTAGVRQLLDKGADTSLKTVYGSLPLHYAAASGNLDILKMLRNDLQGEGHANHVDVRNNTALYYACGNKNPGVIDELLSQVDPNVGGTAETPLPLLKVVELGDKDLAQTLVNAGADSTFLDDPPPGFVVNQALTIYTPSGMEV